MALSYRVKLRAPSFAVLSTEYGVTEYFGTELRSTELLSSSEYIKVFAAQIPADLIGTASSIAIGQIVAKEQSGR